MKDQERGLAIWRMYHPTMAPTRFLFLLLSMVACGAKETYVPQQPDPADFGFVVPTGDTAATGDTGVAR